MHMGAPKGHFYGLTPFSFPEIEFFGTDSYRGKGSYEVIFCEDTKIFAAIKSLILASKPDTYGLIFVVLLGTLCLFSEYCNTTSLIQKYVLGGIC